MSWAGRFRRGKFADVARSWFLFFPLCFHPSALRKEPLWALQAGGRGGRSAPRNLQGPRCPFTPLSPCLWPCLRGLRGEGGWCSPPGIWPRACVCCTWLLGVWLCGSEGKVWKEPLGPPPPYRGTLGLAVVVGATLAVALFSRSTFLSGSGPHFSEADGPSSSLPGSASLHCEDRSWGDCFERPVLVPPDS